MVVISGIHQDTTWWSAAQPSDFTVTSRWPRAKVQVRQGSVTLASLSPLCVICSLWLKLSCPCQGFSLTALLNTDCHLPSFMPNWLSTYTVSLSELSELFTDMFPLIREFSNIPSKSILLWRILYQDFHMTVDRHVLVVAYFLANMYKHGKSNLDLQTNLIIFRILLATEEVVAIWCW